MKEFLSSGDVYFEAVKGVGDIHLTLSPEERVYTFIGENGIGKTKLLESLFSVLLLSHSGALSSSHSFIDKKLLPFAKAKLANQTLSFETMPEGAASPQYAHFSGNKHSLPIVYLSAQQRGVVDRANTTIRSLGNRKQRLEEYLTYLFEAFYAKSEKLKSLNMDTHIEEWFIQRAQSANPYQAKEDNRAIEIKTLLALLHQVDNRVDTEFLEISGDNRVFIEVNKVKTELANLSSGFSSILKILQSIIAGYSYFTNETQIAQVRGIVLIDEIESHLHNKWQVHIIPLLKQLFPNTTFFITTHSSLVISQLKTGEAYRLIRNQTTGILEAQQIESPSKVSFIDLLNDAFDVDLNQLKIQTAIDEGQEGAKRALLALVEKELAQMEGGK
ncbi:AAA family ATPase [Pelistega suis]|uniref:AAA family ATPase n=1 Tax=Pelistega suis TaxID=1631957 RepID=UPI00211CDE78|nr:AAA family ATPase [Pelistega suis]